ncbi:MAG: hypothetical protein ACI8SK_001626, partial [Shewanella sp.]
PLFIHSNLTLANTIQFIPKLPQDARFRAPVG